VVRRKRARTVALAAWALLVGLAFAGCGRQAPTLAPTAAQLTPSPAAPPSGQIGPSPAASESPAATDSPSAPAGPPTPDPVASELDQINQLINDINNSVNSSDTSQAGGE
jgi:hypothetical protein